MTLDADHTTLLGESHKSILQVLAAFSHNPAVVHNRTVFLLGSTAEHTVAVNLLIEHSALLEVDLVHIFNAADGVLNPLQGLVHNEDGAYRRSVEHRDVLSLFSSVGAEVNHSGQRVHILTVGDLAEDVLADDVEGDTGGADVLLSTTVDETVLLDVDGTAHNVRAHIGNQHNVVDLVSGEVLADFSTVDGVVGRDVEVVGVSGNGPTLRDIAVGLVLAAGHDNGLAEVFSLFCSLLCPNTGLQVGSLLVEQVGGNIHKAGAGTATEEQDFILSGDVQKVAPQLTGLFHSALPTRSTVRYFEQTDTGVVEIADGIDGRFNGLFGQDARTCVEIISCFHL